MADICDEKFTVHLTLFIPSEIPGFLSSEECDHVMSMATKVGLHGSYMHSDTYLDERKNTIKGRSMHSF